MMRFSNATNTPRTDGVPGNLRWASHEYATTAPFNADNTRVLLIHQAYYGLYSTNGTLIRQLVQVCASCAPRWSRTDLGDVFYYFKGKQVYSYNQNTNVSTALARNCRTIRSFTREKTTSVLTAIIALDLESGVVSTTSMSFP